MPVFLLILFIQLARLFWVAIQNSTFLAVAGMVAILATYKGLEPVFAIACGAITALALWIGVRRMRRAAEARRWTHPVLYRLLRALEVGTVCLGPFMAPQGLALSVLGPEATLPARITVQAAAGLLVAYTVYRSYDREFRYLPAR